MKKACLIISGIIVLLLVISGIVTVLYKQPVLFEQNRVALIRVEGAIIDSSSPVDEIREYVKDSSIKAIILRVNSPGGAVAPSQEIYEEVKKAVEKKPVVVSMGAVAASGGYYISAPATKILANPGTLTGSIGVIMEIPNLSGLMEKIGVKAEVIKSGKHKDIASAFRGIGKEEREILQGVMDNVHEQFMKAVSEGREMEMEDVRNIADGRVFSGQQALEVGLVDELGNLEDAIDTAAGLGGIKGEPKVVSKREKPGILELLDSKFTGKIKELLPAIELKYLLSP
jgi:protease-4